MQTTKHKLLRILISIPLIIWGFLTFSYGVFCVLYGGPDPGAGSGGEGVIWGFGAILFGIILFCIGKYVWDKSKGKF